MSQPDGSSSLPAVLSSDHRSITAALEDPALVRAGEHGATLRERLVTDLVRHFVAEEQYLFPALRERLSDGAELAHREEARDRAIEGQLKELEDDLDEAQATDLVHRIAIAFAAHVDEQDRCISALARTLTAEQLTSLGEGVLGAEQLAPTRPRSIAPDGTAANKVVSLVSGFIDKVRDHYSGRAVEHGPLGDVPLALSELDLQSLVGLPFAQARAIVLHSGGQIRSTVPGGAVTTEFRPTRVTVVVVDDVVTEAFGLG
ncbi:MAG: hypothetical protein QOE97_2651 [Pseudonocardiales bacterium]|nr:hypothetical protein [Pseudonocardiales bacterium]